jgi:hypothetical protein
MNLVAVLFTFLVMALLGILGFTNFTHALPLNDKFLHFTCLGLATGIFYFILDVEELVLPLKLLGVIYLDSAFLGALGESGFGGMLVLSPLGLPAFYVAGSGAKLCNLFCQLRHVC